MKTDGRGYSHKDWELPLRSVCTHDLCQDSPIQTFCSINNSYVRPKGYGFLSFLFAIMVCLSLWLALSILLTRDYFSASTLGAFLIFLNFSYKQKPILVSCCHKEEPCNVYTPGSDVISNFRSGLKYSVEIHPF